MAETTVCSSKNPTGGLQKRLYGCVPGFSARYASYGLLVAVRAIEGSRLNHTLWVFLGSPERAHKIEP